MLYIYIYIFVYYIIICITSKWLSVMHDSPIWFQVLGDEHDVV